MGGNFSVMTQKLADGYRLYAEVLRDVGLTVILIPVGHAFAALHNQAPAMWHRLYQSDSYHPTGLGSFLAGTHFAAAIANHSRFAGLFPHGLQVSPAWPSSIVPYQGQKAPSADDLAV